MSTLTKVLGVLERHNNNLSEPIVAAQHRQLYHRQLARACGSKKGSKTLPRRIRIKPVCSFCRRKTWWLHIRSRIIAALCACIRIKFFRPAGCEETCAFALKLTCATEAERALSMPIWDSANKMFLKCVCFWLYRALLWWWQPKTELLFPATVHTAMVSGIRFYAFILMYRKNMVMVDIILINLYNICHVKFSWNFSDVFKGWKIILYILI